MVTFTNTGSPDAVELRGVSQSYDGGKTHVLKDLDFLIEHQPQHGRFVAILGTSGCGKSTILRYIAGLQRPTAGEVLINGQPRSEKDVVAMVFQQYSSLPWYTVLENVMLPLRFKGLGYKQARARAIEMLKTVGLEGHEGKYAKYPLLSGGQLQRVAIARSLISSPNIILMDEPFGALDTNTRLRMQLMLLEIWEQLTPTVIFVTHDIQEAVFLADHIYVMKGGPGEFVYEFKVDSELPFHRDLATKRSGAYIRIVNDVEDALMSLGRK